MVRTSRTEKLLRSLVSAVGEEQAGSIVGLAAAFVLARREGNREVATDVIKRLLGLLGFDVTQVAAAPAEPSREQSPGDLN